MDCRLVTVDVERKLLTVFVYSDFFIIKDLTQCWKSLAQDLGGPARLPCR